MQVVKAAAVRSEINVTPLVDVVLVLLIIFMVITPMLQKGPPVTMPMTLNPPKKPEDAKQLLVTIRHDQVVYLDKDPFARDALAAKMGEAFQRNPGSTVVIKGDARLTYGDVKKAMLDVKAAGFQEVGLIVNRRDVGQPEIH